MLNVRIKINIGDRRHEDGTGFIYSPIYDRTIECNFNLIPFENPNETLLRIIKTAMRRLLEETEIAIVNQEIQIERGDHDDTRG